MTMLVIGPGPREQHSVPQYPWLLRVEAGYNWTSGSEEKAFESVDGRTTDGRTKTDYGACLAYKLPRSCWLRYANNLLADRNQKRKLYFTERFYIMK